MAQNKQEPNNWLAIVFALVGINLTLSIFSIFEEAMIGVSIGFNISMFIAIIILFIRERILLLK